MNRPLSIIVIEDDKSQRDLFVAALKQDDQILAQGVGTLAEGERLAKTQHQYGYLIDLGLKDAKDQQAVERIHKTIPQATIVVITGAPPDVQQRAKDAGATRVIEKGSEDSYGAGLRRAVREAFVQRDMELLHAPVKEALRAVKDLAVERLAEVKAVAS
jgi:DNA-binding NtrC family response regulator